MSLVDELVRIGAGPGERATLLQVSSAFCAPCRAARRVLARVADAVPGVRHVDVDVADAPVVAALLAVTSTPTVAVLDAAGDVIVRAEGVPTTAQVVRALSVALPDVGPAGGGASASGPTAPSDDPAPGPTT